MLRALLLCHLLGLAAPQSAPTAALRSTATVEQWRVVTLNFSSSAAYANPFTDVAFSAVFTLGNTSITRAGYWNGAASFGLRFHGPALGAWAWRTSCSNASSSALGASMIGAVANTNVCVCCVACTVVTTPCFTPRWRKPIMPSANIY